MRVTQGAFSFLPDLSDMQIRAQVEYCLRRDWSVGEKIFRRERVNAAVIEGDSFHRYARAEMRQVMAAQETGSHFSHFGPEEEAMPLASLRQVPDHAAEHGYGVPAFNVNNLEQEWLEGR